MMEWIRRNRGLITGILAVAFIGTWLSLVCQTCQAYADIHKPISSDAGHEDQCSHGKDTKTPLQPVTVDDHCDKDCDCSAVAITVSTIQPLGLDKDIETYKKSFVPVVTSLSFTLNYHANILDCRKRPTPERAHYLPIERFCVLLN